MPERLIDPFITSNRSLLVNLRGVLLAVVKRQPGPQLQGATQRVRVVKHVFPIEIRQVDAAARTAGERRVACVPADVQCFGHRS